MQIANTPLPGCFELTAPVHRDERGAFTKVMVDEFYNRHGLTTQFAEEYFSVSKPRVIRGMHFQTPPHEHTKVVYCARGHVLDVLLDLRIGSPTFGKFASFNLSADAGNILYIAAGVAHGFLVPPQSGDSIMVYKVTSRYSPAHDGGVLWDSAGIPWPEQKPIISNRDQSFPPLSKFVSPFRFTPVNPGS